MESHRSKEVSHLYMNHFPQQTVQLPDGFCIAGGLREGFAPTGDATERIAGKIIEPNEGFPSKPWN